MELALVVWAISILGSVNFFLFCIASGMILVALVRVTHWADSYDSVFPSKTVFGWISAGVFFYFLLAILPTEKQAYTIAAAYAGQQIAENKRVQDIGGKVVTLLEKKLDEAIKEKK